MNARRVEDLEEYVTRLEEDPVEAQALFQEVLILFTDFFRNPESFEALRRVVFPRLREPGGAFEPIRVWSAGCSTGEEAYSVAMLLLEYFTEQPGGRPFVVFATDVSDAALERARVGLYPAKIARAVSPPRLERFFTKTSAGYRIRKAVRELCVFARHDLTSDPPLSNLDLILCRNVLMYMGVDLQRKIVAAFHYALKPGGSLMLGPAEAITRDPALFRVEDMKHRIYTKESGPSASTMPAEHPVTPPPISHPRVPAVPPSARWMETKANRLVEAHHAAAGVLVDERFDILRFYGHTGAYLEPPNGEPTVNLLSMAREGLRAGIDDALTTARRTSTPVRGYSLRVRHNGVWRNISVQVLPLTSGGRPYFLVLFHDAGAPERVGNRNEATRRSPRRRR